MTAPVDFDSLGVGNFGAVPKATVDYCDGPDFLNLTQIERYTARWAAWQASDGIRLARTDAITSPDGLVGSLSGLFDGETTTHLSLCFEQNARPVIAIQQDETTIEIRRFISDEPVSYIFEGVSPLMFFNGVLVYVSGDTDAVCYYLDLTRTKVMMRVQRDNFATEYTVAEGWETPLTKLQKVDRIDYRAYIWGNRQGDTRKDSRQVIIKSGLYPFWPFTISDDASNSVSFQSGEYIDGVLQLDAILEAGVNSVGFYIGEYFDAIVDSAGVDYGTNTVGFVSGNYENAVIDTPDLSDAGTVTLSFIDGEYVLTVVAATTPPETSTLAVSFLEGTYEAA